MLTKESIIGGVTFTIEAPEEYYTFRVYQASTGQWYAKRLTEDHRGQTRATYIGRLDTFTGQVELTPKSVAKGNEPWFVLLNRVLARVWCDDHEAYLQHGYDVYAGEMTV